MWAKIMKERFSAKNDKSMMLRFHTQTGGSTLTAQQPVNNISRVTIQAMAAVLGGTQSLHTNSFDEALGLPTEESVSVALRTQQIIAHESGVTDTIDPLAGSYFIENLTDEIEHKAFEYINKIDEIGGSIEAIKNGYFHDEILRNAYQHQMDVEEEEKIIVGVNKFEVENESSKDILRIDSEKTKSQIDRVKKLKNNRDNELVEKTLDKLEKTANSDENLMPEIITCVESYATLGEISDTLRNAFGTYHEGDF